MCTGQIVLSPPSVAIRQAHPRAYGVENRDAIRVPESQVHPRAHGVDSTVYHIFLKAIDSSPRIRGRPACSRGTVCCSGLISAYTGQIHKELLQNPVLPVHPRIHGVDTKFPKKIPATEGWLLPPQNSTTDSVCIIFLEHIFADNTFWSFSMFFRKRKEMPMAPLSRFVPLL